MQFNDLEIEQHKYGVTLGENNMQVRGLSMEICQST